MKNNFLLILTASVLVACQGAEKTETKPAAASAVIEKAASGDICTAMGPQTPRDISSVAGLNLADFAMAPDSSQMNLCNIHTHTNAEHKGPGFSVFVDDSDYGGYACNNSDSLSEAELAMPEGDMAFGKVKTGDTIEVHWVHTSCDLSLIHISEPTRPY